ncbi:hypothetical protein KY290_017624 [Solanum tuberosum]|uniref:Uncharacterized protein n=1 Tax=Solanum tuberosum TaxID=4113 RepID=A0ABQ7VC22_SOLTU|nr:hypothetical protein KY290_017624 [Solanum tuberosum]
MASEEVFIIQISFNDQRSLLNSRVSQFFQAAMSSLSIYAHISDLDCWISLLAFAEYLSEGESIPVQYLDSKLNRIRYDVLLWEYSAKKMEEEVVSENEAPPRMIRPPARIDNSQLVRIN